MSRLIFWGYFACMIWSCHDC